MTNWIANETLIDQKLYDQLTEALKFNKHDLDTAIIQHSELFHRASETVAYWQSVRDEAKKKMEESYAKNSLSIRDETNKDGRKITEDAVKQLTLLDEDYQAVINFYLKAKYEADRWSALKDAFSSRGYMIKEIAELWKASYFNTDHVLENNSCNDLQYEFQKSKLSENRKTFGKRLLSKRSKTEE